MDEKQGSKRYSEEEIQEYENEILFLKACLPRMRIENFFHYLLLAVAIIALFTFAITLLTCVFADERIFLLLFTGSFFALYLFRLYNFIVEKRSDTLFSHLVWKADHDIDHIKRKIKTLNKIVGILRSNGGYLTPKVHILLLQSRMRFGIKW
jgi:hypothetical protein